MTGNASYHVRGRRMPILLIHLDLTRVHPLPNKQKLSLPNLRHDDILAQTLSVFCLYAVQGFRLTCLVCNMPGTQYRGMKGPLRELG